jgi:hypothetical protein
MGQKFLEALTRDQIETLLDVLADTDALLRLPEELHALDSDLHLLVPSPDSGGSHYQRHALLMKALNEVDRASYDRIITEWKSAHRLRRNLWTEMANLKLPDLDR